MAHSVVRFAGIILIVACMGCSGPSEPVDENEENEMPKIAEEPADAPEDALYVIRRASATPALQGKWDGPAWAGVDALSIDHFFPVGNGHEPPTAAKVVFDDKGLYIHFRVEDQYVRAVETEYHGKVWEDACAEFFVEPKAERGYFNFEINCGGTMLLSYHEDPDWTSTEPKKPGSVPWELASQVEIYHSMPKTVDPEIEEPTVWQIEYHIPFTLFEEYVGPLGDVAGQEWRANFYKCAENNSHPHWGTWSPIHGKLDFHQPEFFGVIRFGE